MAIIILTMFILYFPLYLYFKLAEFYFLLTCIIFFLYFALKYNDGDEYTGNRSWIFARKWNFNKSVVYKLPYPYQVGNVPRLFVVMGNITYFSVFSGFAIHGGLFENDVCVVMPPFLFYIPILRDILLWCGCVTYKGNDVSSTILSLLKRGKSVVYCPNHMNDFFTNDFQPVVPEVDVFQFILNNKIPIIPVLIENENARYWIWKNKLQRYFYYNTRWKWPFPFFFFVKLFGRNKPNVKVNIHLGPQMDVSLFEDTTQLSESFRNHFIHIIKSDV